MSPNLSSSVLIFLLPFLTEGVHGLDLPRNFEARQVFTPTADPSPPPSQTPLIIINDFVGVLSTCTIHDVSWFYAGPSVPLSFFATNLGVLQDLPPPSLSSRPTPTFTNVQVLAVPSGATTAGTITVPIVEGFEPRASSVPWKVNVPPGWYQILARTNSENRAQSSPFYVQLGSDTSCLTTTPTSSSSSSSSSSLPSSPPPSSTPVETTTPIPSSASKDSPVGVIVGVVAGVTVFMILVLMIYLCLRRRKNTLDRPIGGQTGGARLTRGWGGLGSLNSTHSGKLSKRRHPSRDFAAPTRNPGHHSIRDSLGPIFVKDEDQRSGNSPPFSPFEEKFSTSPASYTKNPFDDAEGGLALATLPSNGGRPMSSRSSLQEQISPSHLYSSSTGDNLTQPHEVPHTSGRRPSVDTASYSSAYPPLPHGSPSPLAALEMARSYSASSSSGGVPSSSASQQQKKKVNRQSTGSQSATPRKTPRKPVPAYDPSVPPTISTYTTTVERSPPSTDYTPSLVTPINTSSPVISSGQGHYSTKSRQTPSPPESTGNLVHKSSFGPGGIEGKPVHYLIPDMPLPKKD